MTVLALANELRGSGWLNNRKVLILAARFYKGLETIETLIYAGLREEEIQYIISHR